MSDAELFEAKVVVLDILGWGIPPQYLLDCGISELAVVVCLAQLKLRIPQELEPLIDEAERETGTFSLPAPAPVAPNLPPSTLSSNALPFKPAQGEAMIGPSNQLASPGPSRPSPTSSAELIDMEQQRKQELLARRAALQSMRKNGNLSYGAPSNSATPASLPPRPHPLCPTSPPHSTPKPTEVDAFLADLMPNGEDSTMQNGDHDSSGEVERALEAEDEPSSSTLHLDATYGASTSTYSPSFYDPNAATSDGWDDPSSSSHRFNPAPPTNYSSKRMGKRPVAADFVAEFNSIPDPSPPTSFPSPSPSFAAATPTISEPTPIFGNARRRRHFGAQVQQRLVLELSDGEESSDEDDETPNHAPKSTPAASASFTPVISTAQSREGSAAPTADEERHRLLLLKKQREIESMRERIRLMEEKKKRPTLMSSVTEDNILRGTPEPLSTVTPTSAEAPRASNSPTLQEIVIKKEDSDDMVIDSPVEMTMKCM